MPETGDAKTGRRVNLTVSLPRPQTNAGPYTSLRRVQGYIVFTRHWAQISKYKHANTDLEMFDTSPTSLLATNMADSANTARISHFVCSNALRLFYDLSTSITCPK